MTNVDWNRVAMFVLRLGVAFAFLYPAINAWTNPSDWIGYFPPFTRGIVDDATLLHAFGIVEIVIAVWIIWGKYIFWPCVAATVMLVGIVVFNMNNFVVIFRDLSIAAASLALTLMNLPRSAPPSSHSSSRLPQDTW
ncbi:hypothetical protein A2763_02380 [Candidatus Kaiserbacteria bacterium RIFCSPHIGHO2_01_FULL_54_36]|uniref:DoxX family protein n=1 Tax=Candidatus Kaiserbacteria bacterium RIFCSPHIGHO2_01_FULL_54_36 TaxID=1798482 RepID=A0A1F6CNN9_9BACT|nr:MAG: hypothetical protein A2763_02380 [Candidatus Kaiserbacteria bacterium RIFCSPHIGHO2_01_FULL_54_36]OGG76006.1 MAG: hypothetical protein A3A41_03485 [Candidatus Kaiserbacteria bacterium RIFCSPLOWO2_01_FULL_54_22]